MSWVHRNISKLYGKGRSELEFGDAAFGEVYFLYMQKRGMMVEIKSEIIYIIDLPYLSDIQS
jgi:hypothetical protein